MGVCFSNNNTQDIKQEILSSQHQSKSENKKRDSHFTESQNIQLIQQSSELNEYKRLSKKRIVKIDNIGEEEKYFENFLKQDKIKKPSDFQLILNALSKNNSFNNLNSQDLELIVEQMFYCITQDNQFVFNQGDLPSCYFVIERGQCQIIINNEIKKVIKQSDSFGELALLFGAPRSASIKTIGDCGFWALDRMIFKKIIENLVAKDFQINRKFLEQIQLLEIMTDQQKNTIASILVNQSFQKGEIIVNEGDQADSLFIVKNGSVNIIQNNQIIQTMKTGEYFGEQCLLQNCSKREYTVKAATENVQCVALGKSQLSKIFGNEIETIFYNNMIKISLEQNVIMKNLSKIQIEKVIQISQQCCYNQNDTIIDIGEVCDKIIILLKGSILIDNLEINNKGFIFGDIYLKNQTKMENKIIANQEAIVAEFKISDFISCLGVTVDEFFNQNKQTSTIDLARNNSTQNKIDISINDFIFIKKISHCHSHIVYLIQKKADFKLYQLKIVSKAFIVEQKLEKFIKSEKYVLEKVDCPFSLSYVRSLLSENQVFFLFNYVKGIELFDVIRQIGLLNTYDTQFYVASLLIYIEYLHGISIIHRDIKPENILVDKQGYIIIKDMESAKLIFSQGSKTFTVIGTPHYMAPEVMNGKGYSFFVDLWSIGICFYEFMSGGVPFAEEIDDPYEIYQEILNKKIKYPTFIKDKLAIKLMDQLLNKTPELRLGRNYAAIKANKWFQYFDWQKLINFELKSPYVLQKQQLIQEKEINQKYQEGISILNELQKENMAIYKKENAKDKNWDLEFES